MQGLKKETLKIEKGIFLNISFFVSWEKVFVLRHQHQNPSDGFTNKKVPPNSVNSIACIYPTAIHGPRTTPTGQTLRSAFYGELRSSKWMHIGLLLLFSLMCFNLSHYAKLNKSMTELYFVPTLFCPLSSLGLHEEEWREGGSGSLECFHLIRLILSYEDSNPQNLG